MHEHLCQQHPALVTRSRTQHLLMWKWEYKLYLHDVMACEWKALGTMFCLVPLVAENHGPREHDEVISLQVVSDDIASKA